MKNIKFFVFSLLIIMTSTSFSQEKRNVTIEDLYLKGISRTKSVRGMQSLNDGKTYSSFDEDYNLNAYFYKNGEKKNTIFNLKDINLKNISDFRLSNTEKKVLFETNVDYIYRHSYTAEYYIYDIETKELFPLSKNGAQRLATFSPDDTKMAFMRDNNLFYVDLATKEERQITFDGKYNHVINGAPDWVYEEEFSFSQGFYWSNDNTKIAFMRFDESKVKEFDFPEYEELYPNSYSYKYPKAGEDNSVVEIFVYDLNSKKTVKMDTGEETDIYLPRIKWTENHNELAIQRLNRHQNHLEILVANVETGSTKIIYDETNKYYIDITDNWVFLQGGKQFLMSSEESGYNHIYLVDYQGNKKQLTSGNWDITEVYGYDPKKKEIFFQAAKNAPTERQIYAVSLKGKLREIIGQEGVNEATFSETFDYILNVNSTINKPYEYALFTSKGKLVRTLVDNNEYLAKLKANFNLGEKSLFKISDPAFVMPDGNTIDIDAWMITPPSFNPENKYPVLIYVYGGPGHQTVLNEWNHSDFFWLQSLAANDIIIVSINNRGSGAQGEIFKKMTYLQLGKYETEDMITLAKYMSQQPYVDADNIGIYGWSYGGFMAANGITQGADVISTAVSVAPVTNWRYYDNIYTERFMRTPQENPDGYDKNAPIFNANKLKGNFLLIHGSSDDNVHFQNSMELIQALVANDKQFEFMVYPDTNHGIYGHYDEYGKGNIRVNIFTKINNFLLENLKK